MHLSCLGPESWVFTSWASLGLTSGSNLSLMAARYQVFFFFLSSLRGSLALIGGLQSLLTTTCLFTDMAGNNFTSHQKKRTQGGMREEGTKKGGQASVNYKMAQMPRGFTSNWTMTRAFAICLCCCSWWPSTLSEGNSGWSEALLQVIRWDKSLVRYLQEPISWSQSLHHLISKKSTKSLHGDVSSSRLAENFL